MIEYPMTRHAECRKQQRGFRDVDISIVMKTATQVAPDAYMLTQVDAEREIAKRKREIQQLERLRGSKIIVAGDAIITCYHANSNERKRTMKKHRR